MATTKLTVPILLEWKDIEGYMAQHDIVEVVRCKDCKHFDKNCSCVGGTYEGCLVLDGVDGSPMNVEPDFFCSYGERRENDDE